jgi:peroxiredoxin
MVEIGKKAPSFRLSAFPEKEVSLEDLRGKRALFFFYSKDNTSG